MKRFARLALIAFAILAAAPDVPTATAAPAVASADGSPSVRRGPRRRAPRPAPRRRRGPVRRFLGRILGR